MSSSRLLLVVFSMVSTLAAMECGPEFSQEKAFQSAILVFRGKVVSVDDVDLPPPGPMAGGKIPLQPSPDSTEPKLTTFSVDYVWKGHVTSVIKLFGFVHPPEGDGYRFRVGRQYVVYCSTEVDPGWAPLDRLRESHSVYDLGLCPLRIRMDVANEARLLGKGKVPMRDKTSSDGELHLRGNPGAEWP